MKLFTGDRRKSLRETVLVVWPLAVSQLVYAANHIWDRFWLARSGSEQLQASLSATMVAMMFVAFFSSVVGYSSTFIAQLHGDGRERESVSAFAQGPEVPAHRRRGASPTSGLNGTVQVPVLNIAQTTRMCNDTPRSWW